AVLIRALDRLLASGNSRPAGQAAAPDAEAAPQAPPLWRRFAAIPMAVPVALYALVFLVTTVTSVVPLTSFWGSYQRLQGTYTNLSYILLFVAIVAVARRRAQIERMVTVTLATGVAVAGYGVIQHFGLDPLPWRGDVITRVASTMGNSIFVAAYMIMVLPLALYRLVVGLSEAGAAPPAGAAAGREWLWAAQRALVFAAGLLLLLAMLKFGAAIRTVDYRYWWVLPGAVACATAIWWLLTSGLDRADGRVPLWPGLLTLAYLLVFAMQFAASAGAGVQEFATDGTAARAQDWWLWLLFAVASLTAAYGLALTLPRRPAQAPALGLRLDAAAAGLAAALLLVATFFTQSRGPWLGLFAGLFVFVSLLLWQGLRLARAHDYQPRVRLLRGLLIGWVALSLAGGAFLVAFNLSRAPVFEQLREVPYIGRMGRLLEVNEGTGLVRRLIWAGDEHAGGAIGLIASDPLRALIGWGPESMFVAFNPFYPPSLANIEARGASPDRSHQTLLDELVTKGALGLASYLFVLASFVALSWRLMRRSEGWAWQVFFIACFSAVVCHFVEGLTGIPIVSTLMMFWVLMAMSVTGGAVAGHYGLSLAPTPRPEPAEATPEAAPGAPPPKGAASPKGAQAAKRRQQAQRGGSAARGGPRPAPRGKLSGGALLAYGLVAAVALGAVLVWNINPIRADMRFQQGQSLAERAGFDPNLLLQTLDDYLSTVRLNPREDFYYLNLGRVLMSLAESQRAQGGDVGAPDPDATVEDLLRLRDTTAIAGFVQASSPSAIMSYAEAVLLRARELNPRNKDHYANLGRLNSFWWRWSSDPERLRTALQWYEQVTPIAPQDVTLLNERAGVLVDLGAYTEAAGDAAQAERYYAEARELLAHSAALDPNYADTQVRLGDLARAGGDLDGAAGFYERAVALAPATVTGSIEAIAAALAPRPDLILRLRDAYAEAAAADEARLAAGALSEADREVVRAQAALLHTVAGLLAVRGGEVGASLEPYRRAAELQPANPTYSRNYSIVLSDTNRLDEAIAETERVLGALRARPGTQQAVAEAEGLLQLFQQIRGG
ncbi:MAG TPA: hypothetical protein PKD53_26930, partial [Chloroflexaceae bacterium]|nr:hypothetical protein [Chloroflexaceae bacterium]